MAYIATSMAPPTDEDEPPCIEREAPLPPAVRSARRVAAGALLASGFTFAVVATAAARTFLGGGAVVAAPGPTAVAGAVSLADAGALQKALPGSRESSMSGSGAPKPPPQLQPKAHRTKIPSALYLERSAAAEKKVRDLPVGSVLFPIKSSHGWVEVVVPPQDGLPASMGWMPAPKGFDAALALDPETERMRQEMRGKTGSGPVSQDELRRKWAKVRAQNGDIKEELEILRSDMRRAGKRSAEVATGRVGHAIVSEAKEAVEAPEAKKLGDVVAKELDKKPEQVLNDIGKLFQ